MRAKTNSASSVIPSRRQFLKASAAAVGGLVIGFYFPGASRRVEAQEAAAKASPPNAFLRIARDGTVTVQVKHLEFGQGVMTSLPMLVAEELGCDWSKVRAELAPAAPVYVHTSFGIQATGGSSSVSNSWIQLLTVGAMARTMLVSAAANQWKVDAKDCRVENGVVFGPAGRKAAFGELAEAANKLTPPEKVALKDAKDYKIIGKPTRRIDSAAKVDGSARFGLDMTVAQVPNLHTALVLRAPRFGGVVKSFDASKVNGIPGVTHVVQLEAGVAVVGKNYWAAKLGRDALKVEWEMEEASKASTPALKKQYADLAKTPGKLAKQAGNPSAIQSATKTITADYAVPYLAHAPMEPLNATINFTGSACEVWVGSQFQTTDQESVAKVLGIPVEKVKLNTMLAGGGFGRRGNPVSDYLVEAAEIAKSAKVPVKVMWTREDDIKGGYYRPMYAHRVKVGLDASGKIAGWDHVVVGQSIIAGTPFEGFLIKDGIDATSVEGVVDTPYDIANFQASLHTTRTGVPVLWWRSVGHTHTAFVMETMIDELAKAAGQDPVAYRRELLGKQPRVLKTLELAAQKAGWGSALPKGRARGVAVHESFGSVCAQVAEVSLEKGRIRVHKVVAAIDCGLVVNPLTVEAQVQSAIAYGLSAALYGQITLENGAVDQANFDSYPVLRMNEMPVVEVHMVPGGTTPTGVGEPGTPPIAPAVANALFALTGKRLRSLPFDKAELVKA
ncbi:MAG: xanthine dehydrogenase family protein molybdopterin-binding subunit [Betaproteobacteria bacterium]|nr:xanthine dehydrogenase family protein molybdopterin-binding subunit [Betaproteobacteria bacterium]